MSEKIVCRTVAELIAALQQMPPDLVPFSWEHPPFTGVGLVHQGNRKLLIGPADDRDPAKASLNQPVANEIVLPGGGPCTLERFDAEDEAGGC